MLRNLEKIFPCKKKKDSSRSFDLYLYFAYTFPLSVVPVNYSLIPRRLIPSFLDVPDIFFDRSFDLGSNLFSYFCETVAAEESKAEDGQFRGPETGVGH